MKKINILIITGVLLISCSKSGGGDEPTPPPTENQAPSKVETLTFPTDNLLCTTNVLDFEWSAASDPDGDSISYLLEISKNNLFTTTEESFEVSGTTKNVTLEKETAYYWRVKAMDSKNLSGDYSTTYQFYTEGIGETNHVPFSPKIIAPEIDGNVTGMATKLQWDASDVDNDPLVYDVYFDTTNPPTTLISENQSEKSLDVTLTTSTTYYWKIVSKDNKGGQSIGQIWSFNTN
ncbi:hypothetical protein CLV91_2874 [Maribacter vaceletii]|uniref:Fibronectin type-III domain-containing protein n=1 Tax=Maribacter vaceletii TaxID=1206816 RepID=A0A495DTY3_9FLAO|nr:hypothetical protein [Maribacter vaceletii]RKR08104.1 hypothetical protein CLV91_2874 [Maribacter vaceletii]